LPPGWPPLRLSLALLAATTVGLACPVRSAAEGPSAGPAPSAEIGANTGVLFASGHFKRSEINSQLRALAATGATLARADAPWEAAEPKPPLLGLIHQYDWRFDDIIASSLAANGIRWVPIIDYSASWAQSVPGQDHSAPSSVSGYAAYAAAVASRYGPGGRFWRQSSGLKPLPVDTYEIWNEPDHSMFWKPAPNPAAYADLYAHAHAAIAAVQPGARVLIGGLTAPSTFLPAMLASDPGIQGQIDGIGIHPYAATPAGVLASVRTTRLLTRTIGLAAVPLYVTEVGWTTSPEKSFAWTSVQLRPDYIEQVLSQLGHSDCGVAEVLLYAWTTLEQNPGDPEDWYGISPPSGGATPDTAAFAAGLRQAGQVGPVIPVCSPASSLAGARTVEAPKRSPGPEEARHRLEYQRSAQRQRAGNRR
jgi:hypothetical protein